MTFSPLHIALIAITATFVIVNLPAIFGSASVIEYGRYRLAWTNYGWNYDTRGYGPTELPDTIYANGRWPWYQHLPAYKSAVEQRAG